MKRFSKAAILATAAIALPVHAGETILYEAAPEWVERVELADIAARDSLPVVIYDAQQRLEPGVLTGYFDRAIRITSPEALTQLGSVSAVWLPDKGDLIVHRVEIVRDGKAIDLIAQGERFAVLRREAQLEQRTLDGILTATMAVPGLRIGDVIRMSYSTTLSDQALGERVQTTLELPAEPFQIGFGRARISWPETMDVAWKAGPAVDGAALSGEGRYAVLSIPLPIAEREEMPGDAPVRYRRGPIVQASSFDSWQAVSAVLAPYFDPAGTIGARGALRDAVDAIAARSDDPLERTALALQTVQEDVSYLMNGLDGGNYLPQSPTETWERRYGDCKAKSLLLMAMLDDMGIAAEVVLVNTLLGDAVPDLLPMPGAFNHMIVKAEVAGRTLWLDGTGAGARLETLGYRPNFHWALPVRADGAALVPIEQMRREVADTIVRARIDQSGGISLPAIVDLDAEFSGSDASGFRQILTQGTSKQQTDLAKAVFRAIVGDARVVDQRMSFNDADGVFSISGQALADTPWNFDRARGELAIDYLPSSGFGFSPDRARPEWRDIPVVTGGPALTDIELTIKLPAAADRFAIDGDGDVVQDLPGAHVERSLSLSGDSIVVSERFAAIPREIAPADVAREKARAARFKRTALTLRAPADLERYWELSDGERKRRFAPIDALFTKLVESDPDESQHLVDRGYYRTMAGDFAAALDDIDAAMEILPFAGLHVYRAGLHYDLGNIAAAHADMEQAFALEPTLGHAIGEAEALAMLGRVPEALEVIAPYEGNLDDIVDFAAAKATILATGGEREAGLAIIDDSLLMSDDDPAALNNACWYRAVWQVGAETMPELCERAVEQASAAAAALDSRAMAKFRLGELQSALADIDKALATRPEAFGSQYLRGHILRALGEKDGEAVIARALAVDPSLAIEYGRYGLKP